MQITERRTRLAIAGELYAIIETAATSDSAAVKAFGAIVARRLRRLVDEDGDHWPRHPAWTEADVAAFLAWARALPQ